MAIISGTPTAGDDIIVADGANDQIDALPGNDSVNGGAGNDTLLGHTGRDTLLGGAGNDQLFGDIFGGAENDSLDGGAGDDILNGGLGVDTLVGGTGNDTYAVHSAAAIVTEQANAGVDLVNSSVSFTLGANLENLTLTGTANLNSTGNNANNAILGNSANNVLNGLAGDDSMNGLDGNDLLIGGIGNDTLVGGRELFGVSIPDNDTLDGGLGNDLLRGFDGADSLFANEGKDTLFGGEGDDLLTVGVGNHSLNGGNGIDRVFVQVENGNVTLTPSTLNTSSGAHSLLSLETATVIGGTGNNRLEVSNLDALRISGGGGSDTLTGSFGMDTIEGGEGDDTLNGRANDDVLNGGNGSDQFVYATGRAFDRFDIGVDTINGFSAGSDKILLSRTTFNALESSVGGSLIASDFASVDSVRDIQFNENEIVYHRGLLIYNQNGAAGGLGTGGVIADLSGDPILTTSNFLVVR